MESYSASSLQQGAGPMNPMMAMIQRQQQEQQQYEALTAGTTMGVPPVIPSALTAISQDSSAVMNSPHSAPPPPTIGNNVSSYINGGGDQHLGLGPEQYQRQVPSNSYQQRIPQQFNEVSSMYRPNRMPYTDLGSSMAMQPMMMPQQQQQLFNMGNMSPSQSPAPNNTQTQFYSNVDLQSTYSEPSMMDLQTSYMNMIPPPAMQPMDTISSSMQLPFQQPYISSSLQQMSSYYSPVPQMTSSTTGPYDQHLSQGIVTSKLDPTMTSNLTSMPVQAPNVTPVDAKFPMMVRQDSARTMASSSSSPVVEPPPSSQQQQPRYRQSSSSIVESSSSPTTPSLVTYIPKTRQVESYGGVDLKYFEKYEIRPAIPTIEELGIIDIAALTLSLKSGIKMEMTHALNTLTTLTSLDHRPLLLVHCEDLLDTLIDHLQAAMFPPSSSSPPPTPLDDIPQQQTYADLFELSLLEMKSLIPTLEPTSSDLWLSSRDLRLCLFNILRNLSFVEENIAFLANNPRLSRLLVNIIQLTRTHGTNSLRCMDILEFRKCILIIYANISLALTNVAHHHHDDDGEEAVDAIVSLIHDFIVHGTDTYYAMVAMEAWNKFSVHDQHRRRLSVSAPGTIQTIWTSLINVIRRQFYMVEMGMLVGMSNTQLGILELVVMGLYNVVALSDLVFCEQLIYADRGMAMTLLRICLTLAEANNPHFRVMAQRAMELVYALILGGGVKVTQLVKQQQHSDRAYQQQQARLFPISSADLEDEDPGYKRGITARARVLLNHTVLQEKLMMAMLKPASDHFILAGLDDLLNLMADMSFYE
ncbi:hypothetical protein [Absidia glauca]|uniref:SWI/SNF-like complex subunit BAF250 C-terminal domain-containing protein n=1 Tax=Absidia glauca TaxID=4829 RepID=A0A163KZX7_ABSGL|nr:hypothetical protein [Absidia glauca]